jgi:hypothetical protein
VKRKIFKLLSITLVSEKMEKSRQDNNVFMRLVRYLPNEIRKRKEKEKERIEKGIALIETTDKLVDIIYRDGTIVPYLEDIYYLADEFRRFGVSNPKITEELKIFARNSFNHIQHTLERFIFYGRIDERILYSVYNMIDERMHFVAIRFYQLAEDVMHQLPKEIRNSQKKRMEDMRRKVEFITKFRKEREKER